MSISLTKGQNISLEKIAPGLTSVTCALGWSIGSKSSFLGLRKPNKNFDLDSSVIFLDQEGKTLRSEKTVSYQNLRNSNLSIKHNGDNLVGSNTGDAETITVNLINIPQSVAQLLFVINIYDCQYRKQDFSQVKNAYVRLVNNEDKQELVRYDLSGENYKGQTGMTLAKLSRENGQWRMTAIGEGYQVPDIAAIEMKYA